MIPDNLKEEMEFVGDIGIIKSWKIKHNQFLVDNVISHYPVSGPGSEFFNLIQTETVEFVASTLINGSPLVLMLIHKSDSDFFNISCAIPRSLPLNSSRWLVQSLVESLIIIKEKYSDKVLQWFVPESYWDYFKDLFDFAILKMVGTFSELKVLTRDIDICSNIPCHFWCKDFGQMIEEDLFELYQKTCENSLDCPEGHLFRDIRSTFEGLYNDPFLDNSVSKVVFLNEKPLAVIFVSCEGNGLRILYVGVLPEYRNIGVGSFIMNSLRGFLLEKQHEYLEVLVDESNYPAVRLYEKFGFKQISRWKLLMAGKGKS